MTLLEILVKELPGMGGWPEGAHNRIEMFGDGRVYFDDAWAPDSFKISQCSDGWNPFKSIAYTNEVTREQYEAELAESKKVVWSGEGLPPVGCECEIKRVADWMPVTIQYVSCSFTVFKTLGGTEDCYQTHSLQFRPLRSDEERKRDEIIHGLRDSLGHASGMFNLMIIYDAIAAGKIPHVKIV
ncbi:hypothetical protein RJ498_003325 [Pluralibacter gergoviae]